MSINKALLKRIEKVESMLKVTQSPGLLWVDFSKGKYIFTEVYMNSKGEETKRKTVEVCNFEEYVFAPGFEGICILELFEAPIHEPNLYLINAEEVREEAGLKKGDAFRIVIAEEQTNERVLKIEVKEQKE